MPQSSNFYRVYKLAYKDRSEFFKSLILSVLIISGLSLASLFFLGALKNLNFNLLILAGILWLISFSLLPIFFLVVPKNQFYSFSLLFCFIPFIPIFLDKAWNINILFVIGAMLLATFFAGWRMKAEANSLIELNFSKIISKGIIFISLVFFIILGSLIYFERNNLNLSRINTNSLFSFSSSSLGNINFGGIVDDILKTYISTQTSKLGIIGEPAKKLLLEQTRASLSQMIGIPISGKETIPNLIVDYFKNHWQGMALQIKLFFYLSLLSIAWTLLALFNYVFSFLVIITSWLLLKLFLAVKYLQIKRVGVEKKEITFF
ncbi:MAG: hypothetical protein WC306_01180 [Candidatus Paceibacterota bacterium]|jgi:hypothetical protein